MTKLPRAFYDRETLVVARELLGKTLVRLDKGARLSGRIVETEAYLGSTDLASHARSGPTGRAKPMFGEPGYTYVYFTYGMYYCLNCVTESVGSGTAVLLRAIEPLEGITQMRRNRESRRRFLRPLADHQLTNGPAKLCLALNVGRKLNEADLRGDALWLEDAEPLPDERLGTSARVGITKGREHSYRFYDLASRYVSSHPNY